MRVGFIGLGVQGKYMALNLAQAGYDLMVYDVRTAPLDELAAAGARIARSNREVGHHAEVIGICVVDDAQVEQVLFGGDGVFMGAQPGTILAIHSTIHPDTIDRVAAQANERGIEILDAPVSGSEAGARNKTMCYMIGGSRESFEKCRPLFATSGNRIHHTGPLGTGIRTKLAHQVMICINTLSAFEGMRLGETAGVSIETLEAVISDGAAQSRIAERWHEFRPGRHTMELFHKDLRLALDFAHRMGIEMPGAALTQQLLREILRLNETSRAD
jgi:3-hydroxyisobutyrate dehydrogenase-like beta-hydroxyacid dehydrogenase